MHLLGLSFGTWSQTVGGQSDWCEGSVREIGSGRLFCPIPLWLGTRHLPSRTIVYLSCYYSAVTPNWVGDLIQCGEKNLILTLLVLLLVESLVKCHHIYVLNMKMKIWISNTILGAQYEAMPKPDTYSRK